MPVFRLKVHTGPVSVVEMGRKIRRAGLKVKTVGTEHVYVDVAATDCTDARIKMEDKLRQKYRSTFGLRPMCLLQVAGRSRRTRKRKR